MNGIFRDVATRELSLLIDALAIYAATTSPADRQMAKDMLLEAARERGHRAANDAVVSDGIEAAEYD